MSAEPKEETNAPVESGSRAVSTADANAAISTVVGFVALALFLALAIQKFASGEQTHVSELFSGSEKFFAPDILVIVFIIIHHVRLWLGINFVAADETFGAAITSAYRDKETVVRRTELRLRLALVASAGLFLIFLNGNFGIWGLVVALVVQSVILIWYNILFFNVMYRDDKQRAANIFIAVGDTIIVLFSILLFLYAALAEVHPSLDAYAASMTAIAVGALLAIFIGECISQYFPASFKLWRQLSDAVL